MIKDKEIKEKEVIKLNLRCHFEGGSGFLGKILIEKLLRACTDITTIYVLLRSKTERDFEDRLNDIFQNMVSVKQYCR